MTPRLRILLLGGSGQIGSALQATLAPLGDVDAPPRSALDCVRLPDVEAYVAAHRPDVVVNAAAFTRVDDAERERDVAETLNAALPEMLARSCASVGANLVQYSTDYVFSGTQRRPYRELDAPGPMSWYGVTKLAGERAVLAGTERALVIRTGWVYGLTGKNFLRTMMRLAREREELQVVDDQWGAPTWSTAVARGTADMIRMLGNDPERWRAHRGVWHMTAGGETTWYDFANRLLEMDPGKAEHLVREVRAIRTSEYPAEAQRPAYSVLDGTKLATELDIRLADWEAQLEEMWRGDR